MRKYAPAADHLDSSWSEIVNEQGQRNRTDEPAVAVSALPREAPAMGFPVWFGRAAGARGAYHHRTRIEGTEGDGARTNGIVGERVTLLFVRLRGSHGDGNGRLLSQPCHRITLEVETG